MFAFAVFCGKTTCQTIKQISFRKKTTSRKNGKNLLGKMTLKKGHGKSLKTKQIVKTHLFKRDFDLFFDFNMINHHEPWITMANHGQPWLTIANHGIPWLTMVNHG